ncbi:depupylase/deamidase Dop [Dermacoccus nishinomiyaensis]
MTVQRIMGIETEYGVLRPGDQRTTPMVLSGLVVRAYANDVGLNAAQSRWDYSDESPLRDQRGYDIAREVAHESQLTDDIDPSFANVVLKNGARLYVDHAHPEYSSPEVTTPRDAVAYDRAGEVIMRRTAALLADDEDGPTQLYKNNTDGQGASYGTHENYLLRRDVPWARVVAGMTPFFVARQVVTGSGRVGIGTESERAGFQLTQRADFFEAEVGLETTLKRPIINTRDEPHADHRKYRRLHVIVGDANHADVANLLKMGMTSLVLGALEDEALPRIVLARPVTSMRAVSHDLTLAEPLDLVDGRAMSALDILEAYRDATHTWWQRRGDDPVEEQTREVFEHWGRVLDGLRRDPMSLAADLDWVAKKSVMEAFMTRHDVWWDDPRLRALDIQWSDVRADKGLFHTFERAGRFTRVVSDEDVARAVVEPPRDTRAWLRGKSIEAFGSDVASASWDGMVYRTTQPSSYTRIRLPEPLAGSAEQTRGWFDADVAHLIAQVGPDLVVE